MIAGIYKLTSPSGKEYIGKSIDIEKRMYRYSINQVKTQRYIYNAILKYGWENFKIEILYSTNKKFKNIDIMLNSLEIYFIKKYNTFNNGYNLTTGGEGVSGRIVSEKSKEKYRITHKKNYIKENHPWFGKKHSDETKKKIGLKSIGRDCGQKGKIKTQEEKYLDILNQKTRKKVIKTTLDGEYISSYESLRDAERKTGIDKNTIKKRCEGSKPSKKYNFTFKYEKD